MIYAKLKPGSALRRILFKAALLIIICTAGDTVGSADEVVVNYNGRPQTVTYEYYVPPHKKEERLGVLVCTGGLPMDGDRYLRSDTRECFGGEWKKFADHNHLLIVGLGFLFIPEDWPNQASYQFAHVWSGQALNEILDGLRQKFPINAHELYMWGVSAGAQFSIRYAQMRPESVVAVTAHAAGGFDEPREYIPTKFLLTVGKFDNADIKRLDMAREFVTLCRQKGIDIRLRVINGIAHRQTEGQNVLSRQFIQKAVKERRPGP
jgi:poly(3-hydroxybutyrate) depolymerase